jgi:hypothetical protein
VVFFWYKTIIDTLDTGSIYFDHTVTDQVVNSVKNILKLLTSMEALLQNAMQGVDIAFPIRVDWWYVLRKLNNATRIRKEGPFAQSV